MNTLLLKPRIDDRDGANVIRSRIGLEAESKLIDREDDLLEKISSEHHAEQLNCVLIDEAQFLSRQQVEQLGEVVDSLRIPVLCYGLRLSLIHI